MSLTFPTVMKLHLPHHASQACRSDTMVTHTYVCRPISTSHSTAAAWREQPTRDSRAFVRSRSLWPWRGAWSDSGRPKGSPDPTPTAFWRVTSTPTCLPPKTYTQNNVLHSSLLLLLHYWLPQASHLSLAPIKYIIEAPLVICRCPWVHPAAQNKCVRGVGWGQDTGWLHLHFNTLKDSSRLLLHIYIYIYICTINGCRLVWYDLEK